MVLDEPAHLVPLAPPAADLTRRDLAILGELHQAVKRNPASELGGAVVGRLAKLPEAGVLVSPDPGQQIPDVGETFAVGRGEDVPVIHKDRQRLHQVSGANNAAERFVRDMTRRSSPPSPPGVRGRGGGVEEDFGDVGDDLAQTAIDVL